jgi:uncharacterized protein (TIGR02246 family)
MTKVIDEIRAANRKFMEAFSRGDAAAVAALYTADAKLLPPDSQMMNGTDAIRSFWQGAMNMGFKEAKLETVEVESQGDLAYEVGRYALILQAKGGETSTAKGKYVVVWKGRDGSRKLHVDIWNGITS